MTESPRSEQEHWERAYAAGDSTRGWYQLHAAYSMGQIQRYCPDRSAGIVDVGGGASTLADDLLAAGYTNLSVLDLSDTAVRIAQQRLGPQSTNVRWLTTDLRDWRPPVTYRLWHDRAVLHFLTEAADQAKYRQTLLSATTSGSFAVIGVFGPQGPNRCSGLPVRRYDLPTMRTLLGDRFTIVETAINTHTTPGGREQQFLWVTAARTA